MKHFFLRLSGLILALFLGMGVGQGQTMTEDFTNSNATSSYATGSFVGNNSITWNYIASRDENGDANNSGINGKALMLRQSSSNSKVYSNSIPGGIGNFSVKLYKGFTGGGNRQVELFVNGISKGTSTPFDNYDEHIFEVNNINISGDVVIEIRNITSKQVIVDDISWTGYSATANNPPSITNITQTPSADVTSSTTVSISADVTDSDGTISSVNLNWGTSSGNLGTTIVMSYGGSGDTYTTNTSIPAQANGTTVYYTISASDNDGDETTSAEQSYVIIAPLTTTLPYSEDFASDLSGVYTYSESGATKVWEYTSGYASMNGYNSGDTETDWLILPGINLNNYSNEILTFDTWYNYGTDDASNYLKLFYSTDYSGLGDPSQSNWSELSFTSPATNQVWISSGNIDLSGISGTSVWLAFKYNYTAGNYRSWGIDNIALAPVAIINPSNFAATTESTTSISLGWTLNPSSDNVMIARSSSDSFGTPSDGTGYSASDALGDATVIYVGSSTSYTDNSLAAATTYYYKAWSVTGSNGYSVGATSVSATTFSPEPSNHPTGLSATTNTSSSITLSWTDATAGAGDQLPQAYLVKAAAGNAPSSPVDGTAEADADLVKNVVHGSQTVTFTNLTPETEYQFKIWPYTNSGSGIDYKTDGSVPTATATTPAIPQINIFFSEYIEGSSYNKAIEIYNGQASSINLNDLSIKAYNNGAASGSPSYTWTGTSGSLESGAVYVIYSSSSSQTIIDLGNESHSVANWNGDDALELIYQGTTCDIIGVIGTDPGSSWEVAGSGSTENKTLVRKQSVSNGTTDWPSSAGDNVSNSQWIIKDQDDFTYLGYHHSKWNGASSNSWTESSNWKDSDTPGDVSNVIIESVTNMPSIESATSIQKITLESGVTLIGFDNLSVGVGAKVKREISGYDGQGSGAGWHLIATPLSAVDVATSDFVSGTYDLYRYDESTNSWINQKVVDNSAQFDDFVPGIGYLYATQNTATRNFESTGFNTTDVSFTNLSLTNGAGGGWHLLGNPFPANLNFGTGWTLTNVNGTGQVLKTDGTGYKTISNGDVIASNQGFWIQVSDATNSITIPASAATHSSAPFSAKSGIADLKCYLHLDANRKVETRIQIRPYATDGFDWAFDANYLPPMSADMPRMYTNISGKAAALNAFHLDSAYSLPLVVDVTEECTYSFEITGLESLPEATKVYLIDHLTQETHLLNESPSLVLSYSPNDGQERFELQFVLGSLGMEIAISESNFTAYSSGKLLVVNNPFQENNPIRMEIYSLTGQLLHLDESYFTGEKQVPLSLSTGFYLLKMSDGQHSLNQSFFIR